MKRRSTFPVLMAGFALAQAAALPGDGAPAHSQGPARRAPSGQSRAAAADRYTSDLKIEAHFAGQDFTPDGDLSEPAWKRARWIEFDHDASGRRNYPEAHTRVAALWSRDYLYFAFWCRYVTLNTFPEQDAGKEKWGLWTRDVAEVFVNPQPERVNHYYEFEVAPNNLWIDLEIDKDKTPFNDATWNSGFVHATHVSPAQHVWTCEMRIPVAPMGVRRMPPGEDWRLNLFRADGPGADNERRFLVWSTIPEGSSFHVPERFGRIEFVP